MASREQLFLALLRSDHIKDHLLPHLSTSDLCALRQSSSACCNLLTKRVFTRVHVTFTANTFTKPCRVSALGRIGQHIEHFTFNFPHSQTTFLPPLIHPQKGNEISFLYTPHTSMDSALVRPKYANTELADILTQQYPPLFHAATNVPSFINAFHKLTNIRHLTVRCPGQNPAERYRRDIVDYALISLRIAVEKAPLMNLHKLSLSSLHPSALNYLRHVNGIGSVPSASRRWKQIRKLHMSIEAWDFSSATNPGLDHLKIIDDYIRQLAPRLEKLAFSWIGATKGPCPIALSSDALFAPPRSSQKLFNELTSPMSPLPALPSRAPIHMPVLRYLQIRNTAMNAPQLRHLITAHQKTVKEFDFENVSLIDNGRWDDALAPVSESRRWSCGNLSVASTSAASQYSLVSESSDDIPASPSAAVEAVSRELLDLDIGAYGFDDDEQTVIEELTDDIASMREASESEMGFTTKIRKKKRSKHHRHHHSHHHDQEYHHREKRKHSRSASEPDYKSTPPPPPPSLPRSHSSSSQMSSSSLFSPLRRSPSNTSTSASTPKTNSRKRSQETFPTPVTLPDPFISAPILSSEPQPVLLLQPTVYDPQASKFSSDDGITAVQRNLEQEEAHRLLAEDASARVSALQRAKDAVMTKLTREFSKKHTSINSSKNNNNSNNKFSNYNHHGHGYSGGAGNNGAVAACRLMAGRALLSGTGSYYTGNSSFVLEDRCTMDSQSVMVPLMFTRA